MYGAMFGDFVGSIYEFDNIKTKEFELFSPDAEITDDSYMTIAVASACLKYAEHRNIEWFKNHLVQEMQRIGRQYPYPMGAYGSNFFRWIFMENPAPYGSWGNGSAMRVSPCAWVAESLAEAERLGWASAEPTHNHPDAMIGAKAVAGCIYLARTGASKGRIRQYLRERFYPMDKILDEIRPTYDFDGSCAGTAPVAIQAFLESKDYEDAIRNAISVGGDSDTIGIITGSIAEAYYGFPAEFTSAFEDEVRLCCKETEWDIVCRFREKFYSIETECSEEKLMQLLNDAGLDEHEKRRIAYRVRRPWHRKQLMEWLQQNEGATADEIYDASKGIAR